MKRWVFGWMLALWAPLLLAQFGSAEEELLPPEQAFAFSAELRDDHTIEARWDIAEGYYLYRSRTQLSTDTPGISLGEPEFPAGKVKQDEFFGEVEIYRHNLVVTIPFETSADVPDTIALKARSQGCADIGVCYPPQTQHAELDTPQAEAAAPSTAAQALTALKQLGGSLGLNQDDEFLEPEQAFPFDYRMSGDGALVARWDIVPGYYLYREKITFTPGDSSDVQLGAPEFPAGEMKDDEFFGRMEIYHSPLEVRLPLIRTGSDAVSTTVSVTYQGCADAGICYPPQTQTMDVQLPAITAANSAPARDDSSPITEQDRIAQRLSEGSTLVTIATFFGFGLLLAFTPCIFPMIPILSSIIIGQGEKITTRRAFVLSLTYVLAMAVTYTIAGVIAGMFGENLQAAFQNPWILGSFAAVFVLLALSMFDFYELQMPQALQSKLTEVSNRQQGGTLVGVAVMGLLSALIVGPCVAAPLAGALIYIGQSGDPVLGGIALFALSLGMGTPLVAIGTGAGKIMPRAGGWMNIIKGVFGVMLLAVALWMLERIIPAPIALALWGLLLIVSSIYLGALDALSPDATGWHRFWKGIGLAMLLYGALLVVGAAAGSDDRMQPLAGITTGTPLATGTTASAETHLFEPVSNIAELDAALARATTENRAVMLDFYADWCVDCKRLEKHTFSKPSVQKALGNTLLLQADVTDNNAEHKALLKHFGLIGPPSVLFFNRSGEELRKYRLVGFLNETEFRAHLEQLPR